jgi:hypothetical protein
VTGAFYVRFQQQQQQEQAEEGESLLLVSLMVDELRIAFAGMGPTTRPAIETVVRSAASVSSTFFDIINLFYIYIL